MQEKINLAIFSPFESGTETFIKAHKSLPFNVSYFYEGLIPTKLEGKGRIVGASLIDKPISKFLNRRFSYNEICLIRQLRKNKIKCVLAEYGPTAAECFQVLSHLKIPLIVHFHGYDASKRDIVEKYNNAYRRVFNYAHSIVAVSDAMSRTLVNIGCPKEKILVNPCGPQDIFGARALKSRGETFISVGRFVNKKAPYYTLAAFSEVNRQHPGSKLIMIGDGPLLDACKNLSRYFGIHANVKFTGAIDHESVLHYMSESVAYVQHSIVADDGDSEGTPVSILEAQAMGLPVISTYHAGIPEVIIHNKTGFLSHEHDIETMARHMMEILKNPEFGKIMGENGRRNIESNYTLEKHLAKLANAIRDAIKSEN